MFRAPSKRREGRFAAVFGYSGVKSSMSAPDPESLRALGQRLDEAQRQRDVRKKQAPPTQLGIAFRFTTELVAALLVGGGVGWGIDHVLHTGPWGLVVFFMLGAAAGIRGVMRAAQEINAEIAATPPSDDRES
jgi:ATP synthase protein I